MSVKKEASGRRWVQVEVEVPGTPEEVWQAIATGPGISSWFVPTEFEFRDGKPVAVTLNFGPGMESRSVVTAWDPPRRFAAQGEGWGGSPPIADEWTVEARAGGVCVVRVVHSLFASTDDWDSQLEGTESGWPGFFRILRIYLTHFRGQRSAMMQWMAPAGGTQAKAWDTLSAALGLKGVSAGQRWTAPAGVPALGGLVEHIEHVEHGSQSPYTALLRLDKPGPGVAALGAVSFGGSAMVTLSFYLYGDQAAGTVARETPHWEAWIQQRFPAPSETGKSERP
ncbi:MAG TPA: SRPBCC domain-containing protein [Vicinamibacterales bacterium]|nr:SRPBCC domain-containing protein [Vicinamibacterales bacterium]